MNKNMLIFILIIFLTIIIVGIMFVADFNLQDNSTSTSNNTTINITHIGNDSTESSSSNTPDSTSSSQDPEYGSDEYVQRWDQSQRAGDSWAYTHDQPVMTENGHTYHRVYDVESGNGYWNQVN